jgi:PKD repeat protein
MLSNTSRLQRTIALLALIAASAATTASAQVHFTNCASNTGNNASLFVSTAINPSINGRFLRNGDEIAVFTPEGLCAGVKVWDGTNTAVTVWGDDSITPQKDGMAGGDSLIIHVWDAAIDVDFFPLNADIDAIFDTNIPFRASPTYQSDALYNLTRLLIAEKDENRAPIASFTATAASSIDPFQMAFDATASLDIDGTVRNYLWNFGDGSTASGPTVTHTYFSAGNYTVSLSVSDDDGAVGAATTLLNLTEPAPPENISPSASFTASPASDGNGLKINLDAASSADPDGSITSYSWTFGDGSSGTGRSVSHTYASGGTYSVRLTVRDNDNATGTSTASVTLADPQAPVNQKPAASFTAAPTGAADGMEYEFDASGSVDTDGSITSRQWNFGDGTTGNGTTVRHTFSAAGTFAVRLTVTDNQGATGTASANINVTLPPAPENQLPSASFTASQLSGSDYTVRFDGSPSYDRDGTIAAFAWNFGDGATGSSASTTHVYPGAGSYQVTLTVTDNNGGTATSRATIELTAPDPPANEAPLASFTAAPGVGDLEIRFDASASRDPDGIIDSYEWNFGDGATGTGETPSHVYAAAGTYPISLTVTDNNGSVGAATASVTVTAPDAPQSFPPLTSFTASPVSGGDYTMRFDASGSSDPDGSISSFSWNFGDGSSGSGATTTHAYAGAGSYVVTLTAIDNDGNTSRASVTVELTEPDPPANQAPGASFTATPGTADLQMAFDASGSSDSDGTIVSYRWDFGNGLTGFGRTASHTYAAGGSYVVSLTVTDDAGSVGTASATVRVVAPESPQLPPAASFTAAPVANAAQPYTMRFNAAASYDPDGSIASYAWSFGDGDQSGTGQIAEYSYPAVGNYTVTLTVTDNDGNIGRGSATFEITNAAPDPNQPPTASFTVSTGSTDFERLFSAAASSDTDGSIISYRWDFGDGITGEGMSMAHTFDTAGDYVVTLIVSDNDGSVGTSSTTIRITEPKKKNFPPTASLKAKLKHGGVDLAVEFDASESIDTDGSIASFAWEFGDGTTSNNPAIVHTYALAGNYTATLTIQDDQGASASASINLTLSDPEAPENRAPSASFAATQNSTAGPYVMRFDGSSSSDSDGDIATHNWDFGDGSTASGANINHDYGEPGTYSVTLTVIDNQGTFGTSSTSITLTEPQAAAELPPAASFTAMPSQAGPFSMEFDGSSSVDADGSIVSYSWDFGDGTSQQGDKVSHTYSQAGNYSVKLFVTDDQDHTGSATASVTLIDPKKNSEPTASFIVSPLRDVSPVAVQLDASGSFDLDGAIGQYLWDFGDGRGGSGKTTSHEYDASGSYIVSLTITDNAGATNSKADTIDVRFDLPEFLDLARVGSSQVRSYAEYQGDVLLLESEGSIGIAEEDAFGYVYSPLTGDGEVVARVVSMESTEPWAAAGVMIRERLSATSRFVSMVMTNEYGSSLQQRRAPGTVGSRQTPGVGWLPYWVRLERKANTITGYSSIDGQRWTVMGVVEMDMPTDVFIGVAVASNADSVLTTASVDQIVIESSEPEPIEIPTEYELSEIYPNPFNPQARFSLILSQEENVTLQLFDALGRLVRTVNTGALVAETKHEFVIDAADLTSGLYIIRASGDTFEEVRKAILLK